MEIREKSIGLDGQIFAERRSDIRRRVLKGAVLRFNNGYSAFECIVRNQSEGGARLSLGETFALPTTFSLTISGEQTSRRAEIVWRSMTELGVHYVPRALDPLPAA